MSAGYLKRSVVLLHTLPDGSGHLDWMIEPPGGAGDLITFRLDLGVDVTAPGAFEAVRLSDHRRIYLDYEGEISGGRGQVRRIAALAIDRVDINGDSIELVLRFAAGETGGIRWTGKARQNPAGGKSPGLVVWGFVGAVC